MDEGRIESYSSEITVLIVDDLEMNRSYMKEIVEKRYKAKVAANGVEALEILKKDSIDVIITDIFMDKMNGYELMEHVKAIPHFRDIPIIAVTENSESSQRKAIEAGADIYIDRPFGGHNLLDTIQKLTGRDHGRKELFDMDFVLETIPGAVIIYKVHGNENHLEILSCSRGISQLSGWDADEFCHISKMQNEQAIFPADLEMFKTAMGRMIRTHSRAEIIYRGYKKDGSLVWIWFQGRYIGEEDGCAIIEAILLDVSNNTNMYQSIIDESESAVTVVDAHTFEVLYVNKTAVNLVGIKEADYVGKVCYDCVFHRDHPCENCISQYNDKEFMESELNFNGVPYRQMFRKILWHGVDAYLEYTTNIATEKQNIAYAESRKNQQSQILNNIPVGIIVYQWKDGELTAVEANRNLYEMMHLNQERMTSGRNDDFLVLVHDDDKEMCKGIFEQLKLPGTNIEYEFRSLDRENHDYIWMSGRGTSVLQPDGAVYFYLTYQDITAKKELEKAQQALFEEKKTAEAKAEFYSQMSHDMRTPMNGILGIAELASGEDDVDQLHQDIDKIRQSGKYMLNLISDTLDLQRMETGRMKLEPTIVCCQDMLDEVISMMMPSVKEKNLTLNVRVLDNSEMNWYVRVDALRIMQIASNIISNSVKYTPTGGTIEICVGELSRDTDTMISHDVIQITDNGVGMSKEFLENGIFKPFFQERNEMSMQYPGSGLGLSIVKKLVELMGGTIEVESTLGVGTTFSVYLDMEMVTDEEVAQLQNKVVSEKNVTRENMEGKCVLLCEDHPLNAEIAQRLLLNAGCSVEWAENGAIGLELFQKSTPGHFDAVLMDIRMPVMDGLETARAIRACHHPDARIIPIIAMSANAYEEDVKKSLEAGMNDHLSKPVNPQQLLHTLDRYIHVDQK